MTGLLAETINQVRRGEIEPRISNAIGYLAGIFCNALVKFIVEEKFRVIPGRTGTPAP